MRKDSRRMSSFKKTLYERYSLFEAEGDDDKKSGNESDSKGSESSSENDKPASEKLGEDEKVDIVKDFVEKSSEEIQSSAPGASVDGFNVSTLDSLLDKIFMDAENQAIAAAQRDLASDAERILDSGLVVDHWWRAPLSSLIFEKKKVPLFDVGEYSRHVARFVINYDKLLDIPYIIFTKAHDYVKSLYGDEIAEQFKDTMSSEYNIDFDEKEEPPTVYAVGARSSGTA